MQTADHQMQRLLLIFSGILLVSLLTGVAGNWYFLAAVPAAILFLYVLVVDFKKIFFLLLALLPLTVEVWLPNGTVSDMPTEPMMAIMMGVYLLYVLKQGKAMSAGFIRHPITLLLMAHLGWMLLAVITSESFIVSFKFFLAKLWYVITFFFLAGTLMKSEKDIRTLTWCVLFPLCFTVFYVLSRHAAYGFTFEDVNAVMAPFYRNKVAYACMLTIFLPFVWMGRQRYPKYSRPWWLLMLAALVILVGIQFSYTRAAYVMLAGAVGAYFVIRMRWMKYLLAGAVVLTVLFIGNMVRHRNYLDKKPQYEKAITHEEFGDLLSATTEGRDVSTMERVYRWVAAGQMVYDKPWLGFGPGTFTKFYKSYTVTGFTTYVSYNDEGSGIHCYYLMTLVEQGWAGALFFVALVFFVLIKGEAIYHQSTDPARRRTVMTVLLTTVIIDGLNLMNDVVETDKIGSFFFLCMAILVNADLANQKETPMADDSFNG
jgi:O-antigen ligase